MATNRRKRAAPSDGLSDSVQITSGPPSMFLPPISSTPLTKGTATHTAQSTPSEPSSKKRKVEGMQKFYAVKSGFKPGIYLTYAECQQQTAGFKGALFKSFTSREDAEAYIAGREVKSANDGPAKYYAVAVGTPTGIYTDWTQASLAIKGVKGPKYKKFPTQAEAVGYIRDYGSPAAFQALGPLQKLVDAPTASSSTPETTGATTKGKKAQKAPQEDGVTSIWTDGSSLANGKAGSRAGLGVFFGEADPRNVSERLLGEPQTNQRAELMAMLRALEGVPLHEPVRIYSDSQYSINCVTQWAPGWEKKGWVTANGQEVKNQDIIRDVLGKMEERKAQGGDTLFQWVKGHATNKGNVAADRLAVNGAKLPMMEY